MSPAILATGLGLAGTAAAEPASGAATAPMCTADNLYVVKGRLEGAAGSRFLTVRLTNVGDDACSAGSATKAGFRDFEGALGAKGEVSGGSGAVTLDPGDTAKTVVHWTDPTGAGRGLPGGGGDPGHPPRTEPQAHLGAAAEGPGLHGLRASAPTPLRSPPLVEDSRQARHETPRDDR